MTTKFEKSKFILTSNWLHYDGRFVARFKVRGEAASFKSFLCKNFSVEEYFAALDSGMNPLPILQTKGYVMAHIKRWLKEAGYPQTQAGYEAWFTVIKSNPVR